MDMQDYIGFLAFVNRRMNWMNMSCPVRVKYVDNRVDMRDGKIYAVIIRHLSYDSSLRDKLNEFGYNGEQIEFRFVPDENRKKFNDFTKWIKSFPINLRAGEK